MQEAAVGCLSNSFRGAWLRGPAGGIAACGRTSGSHFGEDGKVTAAGVTASHSG